MIGVLGLCKIRDLREQGLSKVDVALNLGIHRNTVSKYWNVSSLPVKEEVIRKSLNDKKDTITYSKGHGVSLTISVF